MQARDNDRKTVRPCARKCEDSHANCEWPVDLLAKTFRNFNVISFGCSGSGACHEPHVEGMFMRKWIPVLGLVLLLGAACSGPSGQTGSLTVNLKDGPYADAQAM